MRPGSVQAIATEPVAEQVEQTQPTLASACTIVDWVAVFFASIVTAVVGSVIGGAIGGSGSLSETSGGLIGLWAAIVPGAMLLSRVRGTGSLVNDFGLRFRWKDWIGVPVGVASQLVLLPAIYALMELFTTNDLTDELAKPAEDLTNQAAPGLAFAFLAVLLVVGAPIVEEIFYRGMLFGALQARLATVMTVLLCGVVFGAAHFQPLLFPGLAAFGIVLALLRARSGRLGSAIVAHATFNAITVAALAAT